MQLRRDEVGGLVRNLTIHLACICVLFLGNASAQNLEAVCQNKCEPNSVKLCTVFHVDS